MYQPIVGFHRDENDDWVAELACLHFQHVRHNPPWNNREWVTTDNGRADKIGQWLNCVKCTTGAPGDHATGAIEARMPAGLTAYKKTALFNQDNAPQELMEYHATARGVWGLLRVHSGSLQFCFTVGDEAVSGEIGAEQLRVFASAQPHRLVLAGPVSFQLEYFH